MAVRQPSIWLGRPPTGTGVSLTRVWPTGQLPWNVWHGGFITRFCATPEEAFAALYDEVVK